MPAYFKNIKQAQGVFLASGGAQRFGQDKQGFEAVSLDALGTILLQWGEDLITRARENLVADDKISFGDLSDSFSASVNFAGQVYRLQISMADYFDFVNKGVRGSDPSKNVNTTSPYKFSGRYYSIPFPVIKRWIVQNGLVNRTDKYRVAQRAGRKRLDPPLDSEEQTNRMAWAIARGIYKKGIKYSGYWDRAVKDSEQELRVKLATVTKQALTVSIKSIFPK
jgi:hypothetical protein